MNYLFGDFQRPSLRFTRVREVIAPNRANMGDAGIDFYMPNNLLESEFRDKNRYSPGYTLFCSDEEGGVISDIEVHPQGRVLIPSGVLVLIQPMASMLMAANKSGICTKTGLIFGAEIVDSPYTGEVHISLINTSNKSVVLSANQKIVQFIHVPILDTTPEEIPNDLYNEIAKMWGSTRGANGFGSTDHMTEEDELNLRNI